MLVLRGRQPLRLGCRRLARGEERRPLGGAGAGPSGSAGPHGRLRQGRSPWVGLRHDWGPQYRARQFQAEIKWLGIRSTPTYVGEPECNGVAERFIRTLKEECIHLYDFETLEGGRSGDRGLHRQLQQRLASLALAAIPPAPPSAMPTGANCTALRAVAALRSSPGVSQASAFSTINSLYAAVKRRLVAFAATSGSGGEAAALRLPSPDDRGVPFTFIPSPLPILLLSASPYSNLFLLSCLARVGREGGSVRRSVPSPP